MSQFIENYTVEVEESKKELQSEYELKLQNERKIIDEVKAKMHQDQNEINQKLDNL